MPATTRTRAKSTTPVPDPIGDAYKARAQARQDYGAIVARIHDTRRAEWFALGGCTVCDGCGYVVTWSTLDGDAYTEYGRCQGRILPASIGPNGRADVVPCTAETVGPCPSSTHPKRGPLLPMPPWKQSPDDEHDVAEAEENLALAEDYLKVAELHFTPHVGARVRVHKGRKVPIGTEGEVRWTGEFIPHGERYMRERDARTELRIGIDDGKGGKLQYTAASNVYVVAPSPDIDMPGLYGSEKQVAWARRLRVAALRGGLDPAMAEAHGAARWWIDQYGSAPGVSREPAEPEVRKVAIAPASLRDLAHAGSTGRLL